MPEELKTPEVVKEPTNDQPGEPAGALDSPPDKEPGGEPGAPPADTKPLVATDYELPSVQGQEVDKDWHDAIIGVAVKHQLPKAALKELAEVNNAKAAAQAKADQDRFEAARETLRKAWGADYKDKSAAAAKAVKAYATPEFAEVLDKPIPGMKGTKYGDHPAVLDFFAKLGKAMAEDSLHTGEGAKPKGPNRTPGGTAMLDFSKSMPD